MGSMAARSTPDPAPEPEDLGTLNERIAREAAAATTAEARGSDTAAGGGLTGVSTSDVS